MNKRKPLSGCADFLTQSVLVFDLGTHLQFEHSFLLTFVYTNHIDVRTGAYSFRLKNES